LKKDAVNIWQAFFTTAKPPMRLRRTREMQTMLGMTAI
jgi:hypothetical protein